MGDKKEEEEEGRRSALPRTRFRRPTTRKRYEKSAENSQVVERRCVARKKLFHVTKRGPASSNLCRVEETLAMYDELGPEEAIEQIVRNYLA